MVFYKLVIQFYQKTGQKKKRRWYLSQQEKPEEKKNMATIMISVNEKRTVFSVTFK